MLERGYRQVRGRAGEDLAAQWYQAQGFDILHRNWRCREGEIDLIAADSTTVVVCEVKMRTSDRFGTPAEAVSPAKQARVRRLAGAYLSANPINGSRLLRFDVACVLQQQVDVITNAF